MTHKYTLEELIQNQGFRQWVQGNNDTENSAFWDNYVLQHSDDIHTIMEAMASVGGWKFRKHSLSSEELDKEYNKLRSRIHNSNHKTFVINKWWYAAAASIALLLVSTWWLANNGWKSTEYYTTNFGENKTITFSDGTVINLNANSTLIATKFLPWEPAREITLNGEAYFQVASHPNSDVLKKFTVHTHDANIVVLGTKFQVNTRHSHTEVLLNEGSVEVNKVAETIPAIIMKPGELVSTAHKKTKNLEIERPTNERTYTSWKDGYLEFDHASIEDVITRIEDLYGYKVVLSDKSILSEEITGKVPAKNLNELFKSLNRLFNLETEVREDTIYMTKSKL